jgi:hypothetical protein
MNWIAKIITDLISKRFWGKIVITFENGKITRAIKEESLRPE